jgi:hypothetical protein
LLGDAHSFPDGDDRGGVGHLLAAVPVDVVRCAGGADAADRDGG